uniref:Uncharacterized protein n=1 Tax=Compsopogon caeruleus TaxID=31354 RepID=A0A7S1THN0_9RHOD|mmetsp:Transcript_66/g.120  ORF Transcript_66/g.120 Transcript_66/m.120 type:complete len:258 (+) Transcript_66:13-786(+)|eukprot:CAMPEP_0184685244 /NCGR_PEP_ID=MMETSP0312-20130426/18229_1 /TAXON_ID=31354 /ORGANISM="Compsopogon coeruleus, Strain SAG 36.94" /LENGTH=257 /DNA_ID=CAMNT_0027139135 /DNA_START=1 /DNA_END=774 /DNA_ORIENTATION=-
MDEEEEEREREAQLESELALLQKERDEILSGVNVEFLKEMAEVERLREQKLAASRDARDYQLWYLNRVFEAEKKSGRDEFCLEKRTARDLMLKINLERKRRMERLPLGMKRNRKWFKDRERLLLEKQNRKVEDPEKASSLLRIALSPDEVNQDMDAIFRGLEKFERIPPQKKASDRYSMYGPSVGISVSGGQLHYFDQVFERGEAIDVMTKSSTARISGSLRHIGSKGIEVEHSRSKIEKISMNHLRTGKAVLRGRR